MSPSNSYNIGDSSLTRNQTTLNRLNAPDQAAAGRKATGNVKQEAEMTTQSDAPTGKLIIPFPQGVADVDQQQQQQQQKATDAVEAKEDEGDTNDSDDDMPLPP